MTSVHSIAPCLWFDSQAEDAARFYTGIFKNSKIGKISRYGKEGQEVHQRPPGSVMTVAFELDGHKFTALNQRRQVREVDGNRFGGCRSRLHRQKSAAITVMLELFGDFDCCLVADNFSTILFDLAKGFFEGI